MLTRRHRLVTSQTFAQTVRRGRRSATRTLVLHLAARSDDPEGTPVPLEIGFVVNKAVGPAVTRNLVKRRLRHIARERLPALPSSGALVVRALPPAATASSTALSTDFDAALARVRRG